MQTKNFSVPPCLCVLKWLCAVLLTIVFLNQYTYAQFSSKQQAEIQKNAIKLLVNYNEKVNQIGKDIKVIDKTRINIEELIALFVSRKSQVYNDLDPAHLLSEYYEAETYASNLALWYPLGIYIELNLKEYQISNVLKHDDDVFSIDIATSKQIRGAYLAKTANVNNEQLVFRIAFIFSGGTFNRFRIAGIRKADSKKEMPPSDDILEVKGAILSVEERREIDRESMTILRDYSNYLSMIGDTIENIEDKILYKQSFKQLFTTDQSPVFNDILPDAKKNRYVPVTDYINLYSEAYASDGGTVLFSFDSVKLGVISRFSDRSNYFYRVVEINKSFTGNYLGKRKVKYSHKVSIKIVFEYANNVFKNFKIERINIVAIKKTDIESELTYKNVGKTEEAPKPQKDSKVIPQVPASVAKNFTFRVQLGASYGNCYILNNDIEAQQVSKNGIQWNGKSLPGYSFYGNVFYMYSKNIGLVAGVGYSTVNYGYELSSLSQRNGVFVTKHSNLDINGDSYQKVIEADYDSTVSINTLNIPLGFTFEIGLTKSIYLFFNPMFNISLVRKAVAVSDGYINYYGLYGDDFIDNTIKVGTWPEFGAYNYSINKKNTELSKYINSTFLGAKANSGIGFKITGNTMLSLSYQFSFVFSDIIKDQSNHVDLFGQTELNGKNGGFGQSAANRSTAGKQHSFTHSPVRIITHSIGLDFVVMF